MRIVDYASSEDQDIQCATCRRMVKRGVVLSGLPGYHGLDCAARLLGKPKTRASMDTLWLNARRARAEQLGTAAGRAVRERLGSLKSRGFPTVSARMAFTRSVLLPLSPYPDPSWDFPAWYEAAKDAWG